MDYKKAMDSKLGQKRNSTISLFDLQMFAEDGNKKPDDKSGKVEFSEEQQKFIDELVGKTRVEARKSAEAKVVEELEKKYGGNLDEIAEKYKELQQEIQKKKDAEKTDAEKIQENFAKLEKRLESLSGENDSLKQTLEQKSVRELKLKKLSEANMPVELLDRVQGSTEEEINDDIVVLKEIFGERKPTVGNPSSPASKATKEAEKIAEAKKRAAERAEARMKGPQTMEGMKDPWAQ